MKQAVIVESVWHVWAEPRNPLRCTCMQAHTRVSSHAQILASAEEDEIEAAGVAGSGSGARAEALRDVAALLDCLDRQLAAGTNFEFCQALLQLVLQVGGVGVGWRR